MNSIFKYAKHSIRTGVPCAIIGILQTVGSVIIGKKVGAVVTEATGNKAAGITAGVGAGVASYGVFLGINKKVMVPAVYNAAMADLTEMLEQCKSALDSLDSDEASTIFEDSDEPLVSSEDSDEAPVSEEVVG